ncbi:MAG: hypothetical protein ABI977_05570 [Acidobacteriota bacterium]
MKKRKTVLTSEQANNKWQVAVRGLENLGLYDKADEIADLDPAAYVEGKGFEVQNPKSKTPNRCLQRKEQKNMPAKTRTELIAEVERLQDENETLTDTLDRIASLATDDSDDEDDEEEDE